MKTKFNGKTMSFKYLNFLLQVSLKASSGVSKILKIYCAFLKLKSKQLSNKNRKMVNFFFNFVNNEFFAIMVKMIGKSNTSCGK
jgi:hypothetical protein